MNNLLLDKFFENYINKKTFFKNKYVLQANFTPDNIPHRDEQAQQIADILAPCLRLEKPSNLFMYGKTGTGKTVTTRYVVNKISNLAGQKNFPIKIVYLNCKLKKIADTEYRLIAQIVRGFGGEIPPTGLPTEEVYKILFNLINQQRQVIIIILDEVDQLIKKMGDEILYNLTRINSELNETQLAIIGISNNLTFREMLDPRVKSSLSEEEILFPPYNALQLQDILKQRAREAFFEGVLEDGVIEKCAAYAAREHGDARRALELLRVAAELAERKGMEKVKIEDLDDAENKIEKDRVLDIIKSQPKQHQATLYSILKVSPKEKGNIFTGEVYEEYKALCSRIGLRSLTQRRVSDIIAELDMLGIITTKTVSKGRYGRTREISIAISLPLEQKIGQLIEEALGLS